MSTHLVDTLIKEKKYIKAYDLLDRFNFGSFEKDERMNLRLIKIRLLYQKGEFKAIEKELDAFLPDLGLTDYLMQFNYHVLAGIIGFESKNNVVGTQHLEKLHQFIEFVLQREPKTEYLILYTFLQGLNFENRGKYKEAKWKYLEASDNDDIIEQNFIYYHLGLVLRYTGEIEHSLEYFLKSITVSLDMDNNEFVANQRNYTGELFLLIDQFEQSRKYIMDALTFWEKLNSPYGISWAIYDLFCIEFLKGQHEAALENLLDLYRLVEYKMDAIAVSDIVLQIVVISGIVGNDNIAFSFTKKLNELAKSSASKIIQTRTVLANNCINLKKRVFQKFTDLPSLKSLTVDQEFFIERNTSLILYLEFLLIELEIAKLTKSIHGSHDIHEVAKLIQDDLIFPESLTIFNISHKIRTLLAEESVISDDTSDEKQLTIDKAIHTPARLSILLYLLGKRKITFSNLKSGLNLSSGNISNVCTSLEKLGLITTEKRFIGDRAITLFEITPHGILKIENYAKMIQDSILRDK